MMGMATSSPERRCVDCGVDISGRGNGSKRCEEHRADRALVLNRESARKRYAANPEAAREKSRKYEATVCTLEKILERNRKYWAARSARMREDRNRRRAANPEKYREFIRRYRAHKLNQLGVVSSGIESRLLASQEYRCAACGTDIGSPQPYHLDHIFPLAHGGMHDDSNLQCLCPTCNSSKGAKLPAEWKAACAS